VEWRESCVERTDDARKRDYTGLRTRTLLTCLGCRALRLVPVPRCWRMFLIYGINYGRSSQQRDQDPGLCLDVVYRQSSVTKSFEMNHSTLEQCSGPFNLDFEELPERTHHHDHPRESDRIS
jgi:hypothetical protein